MESIDKAIKMLDALKDDENSDREILKLLDDCDAAINMVNTQIKKFNTYINKMSKYKYGEGARGYSSDAKKILENDVDAALERVDKARPFYR